MEYKILTNTDKKALAKIVSEYLKKGWELQGGVALAVNSKNDIAFAQALINPSKG